MMSDDELMVILGRLFAPIRLPTARWLASDVFNVVDSQVNQAILRLVDAGRLTVDIGGWIHMTEVQHVI